MSPNGGTPMRLKARFVATPVAVAVVVTACAFGLPLLLGAGTAAAAETVVKIGAAFSMTGPAAVYGASQKAGLQAAIDEINKSKHLKGIKLEAVFEDDASTKEQGI